MKAITTDKIMDIIDLANAAYQKDGEPRVYTTSEVFDEAATISAEKTALYNAIQSLSDEERAELQAVMILGRGASGETAEDFEDLYRDALEGHINTSHAVSYIADKSPLADYLLAGLAKLGFK